MTNHYGIYDDFFIDLLGFVRRESAQGLSHEQLDTIARQIDREIPLSIRAFLHHAGTDFGPFSGPYEDHDLVSSMEAARLVAKYNSALKTILPDVLPIIERLTDFIWYVYPDYVYPDKDDPVVHLADEVDLVEVAKGYTLMMRTWILHCYERNPARNEIERYAEKVRKRRRYGPKSNAPYQISRKPIAEASAMYFEFLDRVHEEDVAQGSYTTTQRLQERWLDEFRQSWLWHEFVHERRRIPYGWTDVWQADRGIIAKPKKSIFSFLGLKTPLK